MPTVLKLGGSLLDRSELRIDLRQLVKRLGPHVALLAGGGSLADAIRDWHTRHGLTESVAHHLALRSLDVTAELVARLLSASRLCRSIDDVTTAWAANSAAVILPAAWFELQPGWYRGTPRLAAGLLPESWDVTSDTLAACVAVDLQADLWLLKSADWPDGISLTEAARTGLVDAAFPSVAPHVPTVHWRNLRSGREAQLACVSELR